MRRCASSRGRKLRNARNVPGLPEWHTSFARPCALNSVSVSVVRCTAAYIAAAATTKECGRGRKPFVPPPRRRRRAQCLARRGLQARGTRHPPRSSSTPASGRDGRGIDVAQIHDVARADARGPCARTGRSSRSTPAPASAATGRREARCARGSCAPSPASEPRARPTRAGCVRHAGHANNHPPIPVAAHDVSRAVPITSKPVACAASLHIRR